MNIVIDVDGPEPVYEQIVRQVQEAVKSGRLKDGASLPTVRQLAGDRSINRNTVARASRLLEEQGVTRTAGRKGTFVRRQAAREVRRANATQAERAVRSVVDRLILNGMSRDEIASIFQHALRPQRGRG